MLKKRYIAGKWAWRFPQEEVPEGCHDEGCHPCDSTLASFAESPINSGISGANITNNPEGCHADNTDDLGNVEAEAISTMLHGCSP